MDSYTGEIRILPYTYAPYDWSWCNGAQVLIQQNQALYAIIGYTYGGDGRTYFNLPNLTLQSTQPGYAAMGTGSGPGLTTRTIGQKVGAPAVQLTSSNQFPAHRHTVKTVSTSVVADIGTNPSLAHMARGYVPNIDAGFFTYAAVDPSKVVSLRSNAISPAGSTYPVEHPNKQPYLAMNFCISLWGEYPVPS